MANLRIGATQCVAFAAGVALVLLWPPVEPAGTVARDATLRHLAAGRQAGHRRRGDNRRRRRSRRRRSALLLASRNHRRAEAGRPAAADRAAEPLANEFTVTIAADVPPGIYDVRAVGTFGVSNPRSFVVGDAGRGQGASREQRLDKTKRLPSN